MIGKLLTVILLLLVAVGLGWVMHQDPGYVLIIFHHWQVETSVWTASLVVLALFIVLYLLLRLIAHSCRWSRRRHQRPS